MPIYEYKCEKCSKIREELMNSWSEAISTAIYCWFCGGRCHLQISLSNFRLKGGGWAEDGYEKKRNNKSAEETNGS